MLGRSTVICFNRDSGRSPDLPKILLSGPMNPRVVSDATKTVDPAVPWKSITPAEFLPVS